MKWESSMERERERGRGNVISRVGSSPGAWSFSFLFLLATASLLCVATLSSPSRSLCLSVCLPSFLSASNVPSAAGTPSATRMLLPGAAATAAPAAVMEASTMSLDIGALDTDLLHLPADFLPSPASKSPPVCKLHLEDLFSQWISLPDTQRLVRTIPRNSSMLALGLWLCKVSLSRCLMALLIGFCPFEISISKPPPSPFSHAIAVRILHGILWAFLFRVYALGLLRIKHPDYNIIVFVWLHCPSCSSYDGFECV